MLIILGKVTNLRPEIRKSMFTHCSKSAKANS